MRPPTHADSDFVGEVVLGPRSWIILVHPRSVVAAAQVLADIRDA